jgi:hypothetical protein
VGLAAVVVSKTSTADMDGDAIGGTIDFRTPRPTISRTVTSA